MNRINDYTGNIFPVFYRIPRGIRYNTGTEFMNTVILYGRLETPFEYGIQYYPVFVARIRLYLPVFACIIP